MPSIEKLKESILYFEKNGYMYEKIAMNEGTENREIFNRSAEMCRIAAACMWEKLEREQEAEERRIENTRYVFAFLRDENGNIIHECKGGGAGSYGGGPVSRLCVPGEGGKGNEADSNL